MAASERVSVRVREEASGGQESELFTSGIESLPACSLSDHSVNTIQRRLKALSHSTPATFACSRAFASTRASSCSFFCTLLPVLCMHRLHQPERRAARPGRSCGRPCGGEPAEEGKYMDPCEHNHKLRMMDERTDEWMDGWMSEGGSERRTAIRTSYALGHIGRDEGSFVRSNRLRLTSIT